VSRSSATTIAGNDHPCWAAATLLQRGDPRTARAADETAIPAAVERELEQMKALEPAAAVR
jgi:hypothetical protein